MCGPGLDLSLDKPAIKNILGKLDVNVTVLLTHLCPDSRSWLFLKGKVHELCLDFFPLSSLSWSWASFNLKAIPHLPQLFSVWQRGADHIRKGYMSWTPGLTGHHSELLGPINGRHLEIGRIKEEARVSPPSSCPQTKDPSPPPNLKLSPPISLAPTLSRWSQPHGDTMTFFCLSV